MKKIIFILIIGLFIYGCGKDDTVVHERPDKVIVIEEDIGFGGITKQQCKESNGNWNECGSPCAGTGADFCIEICQVQCECGGIAGFGCPDGFKCRLSGKIADEMGVCVENK